MPHRHLALLPAVLSTAVLLGCEPPSAPPAATTDGGTAASTATPANAWGEMPTTVNPFYFTEFEEWIGQPIAAQELAHD